LNGTLVRSTPLEHLLYGGNARAFVSGLLSAAADKRYGEDATGDKDKETGGDPCEVTVDKRFDRRAKFPEQHADQNELETAT